jgi:hypothetical protein
VKTLILGTPGTVAHKSPSGSVLAPIGSRCAAKPLRHRSSAGDEWPLGVECAWPLPANRERALTDAATTLGGRALRFAAVLARCLGTWQLPRRRI